MVKGVVPAEQAMALETFAGWKMQSIRNRIGTRRRVVQLAVMVRWHVVNFTRAGQWFAQAWTRLALYAHPEATCNAIVRFGQGMMYHYQSQNILM